MIQEIGFLLNNQAMFHVEPTMLRRNMMSAPMFHVKHPTKWGSFAYAESAKDLAQQVVRGVFAGNRAQCFLGEP